MSLIVTPKVLVSVYTLDPDEGNSEFLLVFRDQDSSVDRELSLTDVNEQAVRDLVVSAFDELQENAQLDDEEEMLVDLKEIEIAGLMASVLGQIKNITSVIQLPADQAQMIADVHAMCMASDAMKGHV